MLYNNENCIPKTGVIGTKWNQNIKDGEQLQFAFLDHLAII